MRIAILELPGAGAEELGRRLGEFLAEPVFQLEDLCAAPDGSRRTLSDVTPVLRAVLNNPGWILVGTHPTLELERRLKAADRIIVLTPEESDLKRKLGRKACSALKKDRRKLRDFFRTLPPKWEEKLITLPCLGSQCAELASLLPEPE